MAFDETPIIDLGKKPVSDAEPCGADVSDDEDYLLLDTELAKLDRIDLGAVDWFRVGKASESILSSKSKDVRVAAALVFVLWNRARYAGLAAGLGLFSELIRNFWDGLFPARPRRRKTRMEAILEHMVESGWFGDGGRPKPDEFDAVDLCLARTAELDGLLKEKMPDEETDFKKFVRKFEELAKQRPAPVQSAVSAPAAAPAAPDLASPPAGSTGTFAAGPVEDVSGAVTAVRSAATFIRKADPANPMSYAIVRLLRWAKIALPTSDAAKHEIEPPDKAILEALPHQLANGLWEHLLNGAEAAFRSSDPLWLDLQRYACAALAGLGPQYAHARTTVMDLTGALVRRLGNGVYELTFRGGTPLCSGETRLWIESEVVVSQGGGGSGGAAAGDGRLAEAWEGARKLAGGGKLTEAVKTLQEGLQACSQRRDRFLWRLRIAQLCLDAQRLQLAAPLLDECYHDVEQYRINDWEPALAVEAAQALYRCRKSLLALEKQPTATAIEGVRVSFAWLCQLDPLAALAAEPAGK